MTDRGRRFHHPAPGKEAFPARLWQLGIHTAGSASPALKQTKHFAFGAEKRLKQGWFKCNGNAASRGANQWSVAMSIMRAAYRSFRNYRVHRMAERTLAAMDDAFLRDIGISRSEIGLVVRGLKRGQEDKAG
ncbi:DUF1127 domain-containing protein [Mesorhizobium sp.]|uniref:DUF1127 domain-containing protein n=1 Tax=Mesorhizobium sp. TaxID=1871066 RepID=UPI0025C2BF13|nr:DUF1127 domain-containing protein [Mesorhizobium sp.]